MRKCRSVLNHKLYGVAYWDGTDSSIDEVKNFFNEISKKCSITHLHDGYKVSKGEVDTYTYLTYKRPLYLIYDEEDGSLYCLLPDMAKDIKYV